MELVTVENYPDLATAEVGASLLEAAGIPSLIPDENLAGLAWQLGTAIHGVRLQVDPSDLDAAREVLDQSSFVVVEEGGTSESPDAVCAACGSEAIGPAKWRNRVKAIAFFFPLVLLAWPLLAAIKPRMQCSSCDHAWG
jgi:hypothetical protein